MSRPRSERPRPTTVLSHLGVMAIVSVVLGVVVSGLAIPFAGLLGFAAKSTAETTDDLPLELEFGALPQKTTIYAGDGSVLASVFDQNRINVPLDQISRTMVEALISIEDYRYYQHGALDVKGTMRALVTNLGSGGVVQGGSSITQQLVKQTLFNAADTAEERQAVTDDTYARKLQELRYAIAVEKKYSKDQILEQYLNTVYFGDGAYGIQAAARHYFDVNARKLNLNQSAILAGLVQNPTGFDPTNHPDRALERRDVVLDRMAQLGAITQAQADEVKARRLRLDPQPRENGCISSRAPFFCNYVLEYLLDDKSLGRNKEERDRLIKSGGLKIYTTVDLQDQEAADAAVAASVRPTDQAIGALAMVEPGTGQVKALAQSRPMGRNKAEGQTFLNYVVPSKYGDSNGFQAGSTFKAFVLADAIEKGTPLNQRIPSPNGPVTMQESEYENCDGEPYGYGSFPISNSVQSGGTEDLYSGTQNSINTFFLNLEKRTGICDPYELAKKMGVRLTCPDQGSCPGVSPERVPFFTLGVADVSPLEMAEAYATFAARGTHCPSRPVTKIEDANGNPLKEYSSRCEQVMSESTADAVNDILRGVIDNGFASAQRLPVPAAGKTGTTGGAAGSPAVWFNGYTPELATAAMIAGANEFGSPLGLDGQVINGRVVSASGSGLAAPMWGAAMKAIAPRLDYVDFDPPQVAGAR
ncbi:transglycosylase domain-containing protein [Nocardioides litoris]|uniref:transglycosylase domain-containing protein n=1 Tax=Nocardioides litoris TaxID=1926648 RepID=UPI0011217D4E|nr:transglycosylase domain-containing protein [Nocardioides litoris]